jgi:ornithine carbamoyltransferase
MMNLITLKDLSPKGMKNLIERAIRIKKLFKENPAGYMAEYGDILKGRTLLMIFEKPSLRTHISFATGMAQFGGDSIYYSAKDSYLGTKETMYDTAKTASRFVDIIMARLYHHSPMEELAEYSGVPVINGMTDFAHPCQVLGDLMTILEVRGRLEGIKLAYVGDGNNNVTHSLLYGCSRIGVDIAIGCPEGEEYSPQPVVIEEAKQFAAGAGSKVEIYHDAEAAVNGADIVYTDSWMSYHIPKEKEAERMKVFEPFRVTAKLMSLTEPGAHFMHCLPALREHEQTAEVIDGPQSIVFDQAENRLHSQKAIILKLLGKL